MRFDERVAIVTGAGKGLGRAYALDLAARGARVVVNNRRHPSDAPGGTSAERTVAEIRAAGGEAVANFDDVRVPAAGPNLVAQALDTWGRLDVVVNNAGVSQHCSFHKLSVEEFRELFDVNFYGALYLTHAAYRHMRDRGYGRIVVSSSSAGLHGLHGLTAYAAAKSALIGLVRSLAQEGQGHGVLSNAICPYAATPMTETHTPPDKLAAMPPELVVPMVVYLASEQTRLNGRVIVAGKGTFRRAEMIEGVGVTYIAAQDVSCDSIAREVGRIDSLDAARAFPDALAAFDDLFQAGPRRG